MVCLELHLFFPLPAQQWVKISSDPLPTAAAASPNQPTSRRHQQLWLLFFCWRKTPNVHRGTVALGDGMEGGGWGDLGCEHLASICRLKQCRPAAVTFAIRAPQLCACQKHLRAAVGPEFSFLCTVPINPNHSLFMQHFWGGLSYLDPSRCGFFRRPQSHESSLFFSSSHSQPPPKDPCWSRPLLPLLPFSSSLDPGRQDVSAELPILWISY